VVKRLAETVRGWLAPIGLVEAWLALEELRRLAAEETAKETQRHHPEDRPPPAHGPPGRNDRRDREQRDREPRSEPDSEHEEDDSGQA
jgi:hypothetical protein